MYDEVVIKLMEILGSHDFERTKAALYKDRYGKVTVGIGFYLKTSAEMARLKFIDAESKNKNLAGVGLKIKEWQKATQIQLGSLFGKGLAKPRLVMPQWAIEEEFRLRAKEFIHTFGGGWFQRHLGDVDAWPADAQLGLLALTWKYGYLPADKKRRFVDFCTFCKAMKFELAAKEIDRLHKSRDPSDRIDVRRQYLALYRDTFRNAAYTLAARLPLKTLHDPLTFTPPAPILVPAMPGRSGAYPHPAPV